MPALTRITLFPIKSLDGVSVRHATVLPSGALAGDRRWAIVDDEARIVNGKRTVAVHGIRASFTEDLSEIVLTAGKAEQAFHLVHDAAAIGRWLSSALKMECRLIEDARGGFPDDLESPGPTLVSTSSLAAVAQWFGGLELDEVRRRFRANLEINDTEMFWEDRLAASGSVPFCVGDVQFHGTTICQRCAVPSRDSRTGLAMSRFAANFAERREADLPPWAPRERFDHFYRLAINTRLASGGGDIRTGDAVRLLD